LVMAMRALLVANAITLLLLLALSPIIHGFRLPSSCHQQWRHTRRPYRPLLSTTESQATAVVTSPITGSETNIKYPTKRGSEIDSRIIINYDTKHNSDNSNNSSEKDEQSPLLALRLSHILFASQDLARQTLRKLTKAEWNFEDIAKVVSNCEKTREEGGSVGWINLNEDFCVGGDDITTNSDGKVVKLGEEEKTNPNEHLDLILPRIAREEILSTPTKPGDVLMVKSHRGVHLVQVVDVMVDVRKLSYIKARKKKRMQTKEVQTRDATSAMIIQNEMELSNSAERKDRHTKGTKLAGVLGGALLEDNPQKNRFDV